MANFGLKQLVTENERLETEMLKYYKKNISVKDIDFNNNDKETVKIAMVFKVDDAEDDVENKIDDVKNAFIDFIVKHRTALANHLNCSIVKLFKVTDAQVEKCEDRKDCLRATTELVAKKGIIDKAFGLYTNNGGMFEIEYKNKDENKDENKRPVIGGQVINNLDLSKPLSTEIITKAASNIKQHIENTVGKHTPSYHSKEFNGENALSMLTDFLNEEKINKNDIIDMHYDFNKAYVIYYN